MASSPLSADTTPSSFVRHLTILGSLFALVYFLLSPSAVYAGSPPTINFFTASPNTPCYGVDVLLSWSVTGTTSLSIDQQIGDVSHQQWPYVYVSPTVTKTYTLTATGAGGSVTQTVTVTPSQTALTASMTTIFNGQSVALTPCFSPNDTASMDQGIGPLNYQTTYPVVSPTQTTTYTMTTQGPEGTRNFPVTITVNPVDSQAPTISFFGANTTSIVQGQRVILSWSTVGATTLSLDPYGNPVTSLPNVVVAPQATTTYTLTAANGAGSVSGQVTINVTPAANIVPNDFVYSWGTQWALPTMGVNAAWSVTKGNSSVIIAVIGTGVDSTQPDLQGKLVPGWNEDNNNSNTADIGTSGTVMAGIVGALTNNTIGVAGTCWNCMVMPIRATGTTAIAAGIQWAADHGARVAVADVEVDASTAVTSAAQYLQSKGGILVVPAGDYGFVDTNPINPSMITIAGTDQNDVSVGYSNRGSDIALVAPAGDASTIPAQQYTSSVGTMISASLVAGVAGLMYSINPQLTPAQVTSILEQTADDLGAPGWDPIYGYGRVNAYKSVLAAQAATGGGTTFSPCDVNQDGQTNVADIQADVNAALGTIACSTTYDINKDGQCNIIDVQRVTNAALGGTCVSP